MCASKLIKRQVGTMYQKLILLNQEKLKYKMFERMIEFDNTLAFSEITIEQYLSEIVKARNNLAHKK